MAAQRNRFIGHPLIVQIDTNNGSGVYRTTTGKLPRFNASKERARTPAMTWAEPCFDVCLRFRWRPPAPRSSDHTGGILPGNAIPADHDARFVFAAVVIEGSAAGNKGQALVFGWADDLLDGGGVELVEFEILHPIDL